MLIHWHTYKDVLAISVCSWILAMERGALIGVYCSDVSGPPMSLELLTGFHTNARSWPISTFRTISQKERKPPCRPPPQPPSWDGPEPPAFWLMASRIS